MFECEKKISRIEVLKTLLKIPLRKYLYKLSKKHLELYKKHLAVYSFDYIGNTICMDGFYEIRELELIKKWLNRKLPNTLNGTLLDIGANIGNHSVFFAGCFNKIKSFEPNPESFSLLNINAENINNINIYNFGISDKSRYEYFFASKGNIGGSSLHIDNIKNSKKIKIKLRSLDDIGFYNENVTFVKIDVEGHELSVLQGGENLFKKQSPVVAFEQHKDEFINGKSMVIDKLREYGYNSFYCIKSPPLYIKKWMPFKSLIKLIHQLLFGSSKILIKQEIFEPDFYPLILAINM